MKHQCLSSRLVFFNIIEELIAQDVMLLCSYKNHYQHKFIIQHCHIFLRLRCSSSLTDLYYYSIKVKLIYTSSQMLGFHQQHSEIRVKVFYLLFYCYSVKARECYLASKFGSYLKRSRSTESQPEMSPQVAGSSKMRMHLN